MKWLIVVAAVFAASWLVSSTAVAEDYSADQLNQVSKVCVDVQANLSRVHSSDALARVYLGREYETIMTKLMVPMNSRIALNQYNGADMLRITSDYSTRLDQFRTSYQQYEEMMSHLIQINCKRNPSDFAKSLDLARQYRQDVRGKVVQMSGLTQLYYKRFETLKSSIVDPSDVDVEDGAL